MGAAANGQCYETATQAANAACATEYPRALDTGAVLSCSGVAPGPEVDSLVLVLTSANPASAPTTVELAVAFPECDPMERYADMTQIFELGLVACVLVFCVKQFIYRQVANQ